MKINKELIERKKESTSEGKKVAQMRELKRFYTVFYPVQQPRQFVKDA